MATVDAGTDQDEYVVRWWEPGDGPDIRSLFATVWGWRPGPDWFEWKYVDDPYLSHAPVTVAERDGEIVGTQAYVPCRIRYREHAVLALQPADAMVHPDHRRRGLYTQMTERAIDRYVDGEPEFFFNFPTPGALRVQRDLGWQEVATVGTFYRPQRPAAFSDAAGIQVSGLLAHRVSRAYVGLCDRLSPGPGDVDVARHSEVPAETLESLAKADVSHRLHVERDARFLEWWFGDPAHDDVGYLAHRGGDPVAGLVTRTREGNRVKVMDVFPRWGPDRAEPVAALLTAVLEDSSPAAVVAVAAGTLPASFLWRFGFLSDETPIVSRWCTPTTLAVRPLGGYDDGHVPRETLLDGANWRVTLVEQDRE